MYVPDWRGGVTRTRDGRLAADLAGPQPAVELRPNGIAITCSMARSCSPTSRDAGGVWELRRDGALASLSDGDRAQSLTPSQLRRARRRSHVDFRQHVADAPAGRPGGQTSRTGSSCLSIAKGARIVADGLHYTNEVRPDPSGTWMYVVETFGRRLSRRRIAPNGDLAESERSWSRSETGISPRARLRSEGADLDYQPRQQPSAALR